MLRAHRLITITLFIAGCAPELIPAAEEIDLATTPANPFTPYRKLDNVEGDWINLHPIPVRPMIWIDDANGPHIYAGNVHDDTIRHIDHTQQTVQIFRTLAAPVALASWINDEAGIDQLLVVSQHNDALVIHDRRTGDIIDIVSVPAQPADIVVDAGRGRAFVSSLGEDVVVEIDLFNTRAPARRYAINSRRPAFLTMAGDEVLVAPMLSGNNSIVEFPQDQMRFSGTVNTQASSIVRDLDVVAPNSGLPDQDLFWLNRATGTAQAVVRGAGTVLLAHGIASNGDHWQLNIEQNNKDPSRQGDGAIRGEVSFNRLSISRLPAFTGGVTPVRPTRIVQLDDSNPAQPGIQYNSTKTVGLPYAMVISRTGFAAIAGLLTGNVTLVDPAGNSVLEWDLPRGCIPRQMMLDPNEVFLFTYCSGSNGIHVDVIGAPPTPAAFFTLGHDPRPADIKAGEQLFFDAQFSLHNNASCATCHIEGGLDLTTWNIGHLAKDDKGPMVTQSLLGANVTPPHHWRGEQKDGLANFRGAFTNLLGGQDLSDPQFIQFEKFVLSLETPPNPHQGETRELDDRIPVPESLNPVPQLGPLPPASAGNGQELFRLGCEGCHALPIGTDHDILATGAGFGEVKPKRQWMKTAPFRTLIDRGLEPLTSVTIPSGTFNYPRIGSGVAHAGNPRNILDFILFFNLLPQQTLDIASFLSQFDTGLAPSTRSEVLLDASTFGAAPARITQFLIPQASAGHADIGVFGSTVIGGQRRVAGWIYDRSSNTFMRDDRVMQPLSFFVAQAQAGDWFVFSGKAVGEARRWAIDFDDDDLENALEPNGGLYNPDTDGDTFFDGHEFNNGSNPANPSSTPLDAVPPRIVSASQGPLWLTQKVGRFNFATNELTTYTMALTPAGGGVTRIFTGAVPRRAHSVVFWDLVANTNYTALLTISDLGGNVLTQSSSFVTVASGDGGAAISRSLSFVQIDTSIPGQVRYTVSAGVGDKVPGSNIRGNQVVIARAIVNDQPTSNLITAGPQDFCVNGIPHSMTTNGVPGPFIVSAPTNSNGDTTFQFTVTNLNQNDRVDLVLEAIARDAPLGACPIPGGHNSLNAVVIGAAGPTGWSFPDSPAAARSLTHVVP